MTKSYVYLSITGDKFEVDEFTKLFCIKPSVTGIHRLEYKFWEYRVEASDIYEGLETAIEKLAQTFKQKSNEIKTYSIQNDLYIKVYVVIFKPKKEDSGMFLNENVIKFLYKIGAEIEVDVYNGD